MDSTERVHERAERFGHRQVVGGTRAGRVADALGAKPIGLPARPCLTKRDRNDRGRADARIVGACLNVDPICRGTVQVGFGPAQGAFFGTIEIWLGRKRPSTSRYHDGSKP